LGKRLRRVSYAHAPRPTLLYEAIRRTILFAEAASAFEDLVASGAVAELTAPEDRSGTSGYPDPFRGPDHSTTGQVSRKGNGSGRRLPQSAGSPPPMAAPPRSSASHPTARRSHRHKPERASRALPAPCRPYEPARPPARAEGAFPALRPEPPPGIARAPSSRPAGAARERAVAPPLARRAVHGAPLRDGASSHQQDVQDSLNLPIQPRHSGPQLTRRRLRLDVADSVPDLPVCQVREERGRVAERRRKRRPNPGLECLSVLGLQPTTSRESSGYPIDRGAGVVGPITGQAAIQTPTTDAAAEAATQ
jgi:hypothetical protein